MSYLAEAHIDATIRSYIKERKEMKIELAKLSKTVIEVTDLTKTMHLGSAKNSIPPYLV